MSGMSSESSTPKYARRGAAWSGNADDDSQFFAPDRDIQLLPILHYSIFPDNLHDEAILKKPSRLHFLCNLLGFFCCGCLLERNGPVADYGLFFIFGMIAYR